MEAIMNAKLVIVTDRGLVKAYKLGRGPKGTPHLDLLEQLVLEEARRRLMDEVMDLAGRRTAPTQRNWGAPLGDSHNLELENQRQLIKEVAGHVERLAHSHRELGICFAAPKEINPLVMEALPRKIRDRIQVNLARDLVKADKEQLLEYFSPKERQAVAALSTRNP
jgi:protein required for attachment to host cells